ncbi:hypothetical protein BC936DRAFT_147395 [Jimgerdemannia flammicorona]|uniref:Uncharacterized protein n=1 Tax=Jimgerdemannia flammicorona TaxID=994334 RepID=A0A433D5D6_9FUNG|nr:hypothetical protein BC936DRAFT_147395 [Jimgerdemannia flammicorona]
MDEVYIAAQVGLDSRKGYERMISSMVAGGPTAKTRYTASIEMADAEIMKGTRVMDATIASAKDTWPSTRYYQSMCGSKELVEVQTGKQRGGAPRLRRQLLRRRQSESRIREQTANMSVKGRQTCIVLIVSRKVLFDEHPPTSHHRKV